MDKYKGFEFTTDNGTKCLVVEDGIHNNYIIVNIDNYKTMARCDYYNIEELINTVKEKY